MAVPTLAATGSITIFGSDSAQGSGNCTANGGKALTAKGLCWGTSSNPTIADSKTEILGTAIGAFVGTLTSLTANTLYYVRAYATNADGTGYGTEVSFTTLAIETPSLQNISLEYYSYKGIPSVIDFFYDNSKITLDYPNFGTQEPISFFSCIDGTPDSYLWDFGDGNTSTDKNPIYTFLVAGTYTVSLTATNIYGSDTLTKVAYITIINSYSTLRSLSFEWRDPEDPIPVYPKLRNVWFEWGRPVYEQPMNYGNPILFIQMME